MPELPEVETVVNDLRPYLVGRRITKAIVLLPKMVQGSSKRFIAAVKSKNILGLSRRAKILLFRLSRGWTLVMHLKMTGQLVLQFPDGSLRSGGHMIPGGTEKLPNRFSHIIFHFDNGSVLYFNDLRQFGYVRLIPDQEMAEFILKKKIGPEPSDAAFSPDSFFSSLKRRSRSSIKSILLDQSVVAGLGNIYVDEVLFCAKVKPTRLAGGLTQKEKLLIFQSIPKVIQQAIAARGTTRRYDDSGASVSGGMNKHLKVYGRENQPCRRCGTVIRRVKQGGRSSHFCPVCQR
ncbi:MAG: DNA-formamidopyrimidine glycosylase [bacterium]|nr:DNA-formamidopyrimidine glycosylase [bacterium]